MEKILITGGAGYVGTILTEKLLSEGYEVICLDNFFFGLDTISNFEKNPNFGYIQDDIRKFDKKILKDIYCVIDLASISNDPAGELDPSITLDINYKGRVRVANLCKECGVNKYFLASTCSIYGYQKNICDEKTEINPLTTYSKASALAEKEILGLGNQDFCCTVFRFATIYGISKRMRFDLVVNTMTLNAFKNKIIYINGDGTQKRPLIDVKDTTRAYLLGIKSDNSVINNEIFNVGSIEQNYSMIELANEIQAAIDDDCEIKTKGDLDFRSYQVNFSKIKEKLSFNTTSTPKRSAKEIFYALKNNTLDYGIKTITLDWYKYLMKNNEKRLQKIIDNDSL